MNELLGYVFAGIITGIAFLSIPTLILYKKTGDFFDSLFGSILFFVIIFFYQFTEAGRKETRKIFREIKSGKIP